MGIHCNRSTKRIESQRGFSILEVIMAMAIFSIGILALAGMQLSSIQGNSSARISTEAGSWAQDHIESMMALPYNHDSFDPANSPFSIEENDHTITWEVVQNTAGDGMTENTKTISVEIAGRRQDEPLRLVFVKPEI